MTSNETLDLLNRVNGNLLRVADLRARVGEREPDQPVDTHLVRHLLDQAHGSLTSAQHNLGHCPHCMARLEDELPADTVEHIKGMVQDDRAFHPTAFEVTEEVAVEIELGKAGLQTEIAEFLIQRAEQLLPEAA